MADNFYHNPLYERMKELYKEDGCGITKDELEKMAMNDESLRKDMDHYEAVMRHEERKMARMQEMAMKDQSTWSRNLALDEAFKRHEENVASVRSFMARADEFREEEYVLFHSNMITSMVRLLEGRPMPIDKLRILFKTTQDLQDFDCSAQQPGYMIFEQLNTRELEQLRDDVKFDLDYISRAKSTTGIMRQCWEALLVVCEGKLRELKIKESGDLNAIKEYDAQARKLQSMSYGGLEHLQWEIESEMPLLGLTVMSRKNQCLYQLIQFFKANIFLKENHRCKILGKRLMLEDKEPPLDMRLMRMTDKLLSDRADELAKTFASRYNRSPIISKGAMFGFSKEEGSGKFEEIAIMAMEAAGESGSKRRKVRPEYPRRLEYEWNDKYLPRMPSYLNRVEYGRRLDSYNLCDVTPCVEKAYKFNIFYPSIVDERNLQFFIEYEKENTETCRLRFQAGPPYQDVVFRIVNREWDLKGFKSTFEQGILHLYFNLKGYWYNH